MIEAYIKIVFFLNRKLLISASLQLLDRLSNEDFLPHDDGDFKADCQNKGSDKAGSHSEEDDNDLKI